jgi:uncharacterized protein involved in response to NO
MKKLIYFVFAGSWGVVAKPIFWFFFTACAFGIPGELSHDRSLIFGGLFAAIMVFLLSAYLSGKQDDELRRKK